MNTSDEPLSNHWDENTYIDPDSPPPSYLAPSSPSYQIQLLQEQAHWSRYGNAYGYGRRLSRTQEMALAMVERKGERRVSGGLRVESGGLVRVKVDELDPGRKATAKSERDKENKKNDTVGRKEGTVLETPCLVEKRTKQPSLQDLQHLATRIEVDDPPLLPLPHRVESLPKTPARKPKTSKRSSNSESMVKARERARSEDSEMMSSPESPAMMTCFERSTADAAEEVPSIGSGSKMGPQTIRNDRLVTGDNVTPETTFTPIAPDSKSAIPGAPKKPPITTPTTITTTVPTQTRRSSISSFLESLKRTYTSTASSLAASTGWVAVGHGSGVPERQVVRRGKAGEGVHKSPGKKEKRKVDKNGPEPEDGWGKGRDFDPEAAKKSWVGWDLEQEAHEAKEAEEKEEEDDPREYLARIANENAMILAAEAEEAQREEESEEVGSGLGLSLSPVGGNEGGQAGWQRFGSGEDREELASRHEELPLDLLQNLSISDDVSSPAPVALPVTAPSRKTIDYRHIVHLAANALGEPRPEQVIHHPALVKMVAVARVDFNHAVMSIIMEATQGPLHQDHYTLHDLYSWYKVTFKRTRAEPDTLQALILAMIQVATGRDLGEREDSTLQALQGKSTVLCAVPLGYCMVHAHPPHGQTNPELEREIENEFTGGRELVTPEMIESDLSDLSDVASGRSIPLTPPPTPGRRVDKGKARAIEAEDVLPDQLVPQDTPPRPSSALPISSTQYSIFPRVIGMVSRKLQVTTELVLFQPQVCHALSLAGMTCEQFQEVMFEAQDLDQAEMGKPWQEREFEPADGRWRACRYYEAMEAIVPFGQAAYVQQLRPFQRALIYLMLLCFDWPDNEPEEFVERLRREHELVVDHTPFKVTSQVSEVKVVGEHQPRHKKDAKSQSINWQDWSEHARMHDLQIGPSTKVWQSSSI